MENYNQASCISFSSHPFNRGHSDYSNSYFRNLSTVNIQVLEYKEFFYWGNSILSERHSKDYWMCHPKAILLDNQRIEVP
ncbi:hypothetical protein [Phocaeicola sartorii]|uniref:hypothetical protein n=1 Tax=Phocaeicola sartorii TaxID=671267 RepID=UPI00260BDE08|nr:hypothetical protein [Phocaeicola sartorii]